jgi:hypothetical protein
MTLMLPAGIDGEQTPMMLKIACPCGHVGLANSETLPRLLTCSACSTSRRVEIADGARIRNRVAVIEWLCGAEAAAQPVCAENLAALAARQAGSPPARERFQDELPFTRDKRLAADMACYFQIDGSRSPLEP